MKFSNIFRNKYCLAFLFTNIYFILTSKLETGGAFLETAYLNTAHLIIGSFAVFLLCIKVGDLKTEILTIIIYTFFPYLLFGLVGAYYNIIECVYNSVVYFLISLAVSQASVKCTTRLRYSLLLSLFLHTGLSIIAYVITYGKMLDSFQRIYFLSPTQRFSVLDVCTVGIPELIFFICLVVLLYINPFKKSKFAVIVITFVMFAFSSGVAGKNYIPEIKYIDNIELTLSLYDDYALFYGNKINTRCVYSEDKETAYKFIVKAEKTPVYENTVFKNRKDKYFDVYAVITTNDGMKIKRELKNVSLLFIKEELGDLRNCKDTRRNNPVYKTDNVNYFTINEKFYDIDMNELLAYLKRDIREKHINDVILYEIKFHEIREGRALKTICVTVGDDDINTVGFLKSYGINHIYEEMPDKLKKYKVDFYIGRNTDFYSILDDQEYKREAGFVSHNLIPFCPKGKMSEFFVFDDEYVYLPEPALKTKTVYLECK